MDFVFSVTHRAALHEAPTTMVRLIFGCKTFASLFRMYIFHWFIFSFNFKLYKFQEDNLNVKLINANWIMMSSDLIFIRKTGASCLIVHGLINDFIGHLRRLNIMTASSMRLISHNGCSAFSKELKLITISPHCTVDCDHCCFIVSLSTCWATWGPPLAGSSECQPYPFWSWLFCQSCRWSEMLENDQVDS